MNISICLLLQKKYIKKKYGKSSVIKAMNLEEGATTLKRNKLIGGHNAETKDEDK